MAWKHNSQHMPGHFMSRSNQIDKVLCTCERADDLQIASCMVRFTGAGWLMQSKHAQNGVRSLTYVSSQRIWQDDLVHTN